MTTVATRVRRIAELEGFDIIVVGANREPIDVKLNGVLPNWPCSKKSRSAWRVSQFRDKFAEIYPGYTCDVLLEDGTVARGNQLLSNVRETYEED